MAVIDCFTRRVAQYARALGVALLSYAYKGVEAGMPIDGA